MAAKDIEAGRAFVRAAYDGSALEKGLRKSQRRLMAVGKTISSIGRRMLTVGLPIVAALAPSIAAASDLEETMNKFNVVFAENATEVKKWGDGFAGQVGRSKREVADFLASSQDLLIPLGFEPGAATAMSKDLTSLTVDLASFNNKADGDVMRDLQAALTGSGEVMKKYGVIVSEAAVKQELWNQGIDPKLATEQQKVQSRMNIILAGTTAAQGDAIRSAGAFANQTKRLQGIISDTAAEIGGALLPVVTPLISYAADVVSEIAAWVSHNTELVQTVAEVAAVVATAGAGLIVLGSTIKAVSAAGAALISVIGLANGLWVFFATKAAVAAGAVTSVTVASTAASAAVARLNGQLMITQGILPGLGGGVGRVAGLLPGVTRGVTMLARAGGLLRVGWAFLRRIRSRQSLLVARSSGASSKQCRRSARKPSRSPSS